MKHSTEVDAALSLIHASVLDSDLLTGPYIHYRPLLADGLLFFLERLSPGRLRRIIAEQARLPISAPTEERVVALLRHVPALHKLGQVVARDRRLESAFRNRLQRLESLRPSLSTAEVTRLLTVEWPDWQALGIELGAHPLAEGSVAIIMPFEWKRDESPSKAGVFKLLKPDIQDLLEEDLNILGLLGDFLDQDCTRYHLPKVDYRGTFGTLRELLLHEVRLDEEQRHLSEAASIYASVSSVVIPRLFPFNTQRLTSMQRIYGEKIGKTAPGGITPDQLARRIAETLVAQPIFSATPAALFHADPHAGNLMLTPEGKLAILDWSLTGHLNETDRAELVQLILGAMTLNPERLEHSINELSLQRPNRAAVDEVLVAALRKLRRGTLPGLSWLTSLLDDLVVRAGVIFNADLMLFRKSLLTLEGVLTGLTQGDSERQEALLDETIFSGFLYNWAGEWPHALGARALHTHMSALDALSVLWATPLTAARWWSQTTSDFFERSTK